MNLELVAHIMLKDKNRIIEGKEKENRGTETDELRKKERNI